MAFFADFSFSSAFLAPRPAASSFSYRINVPFSTTFAPPIRFSSSTSPLRNSWDFGPQLSTLAQSMGGQRAKQVVILADGATWIWNLAQEQFPGAVQIVDEYHARQHVWEVARAAFATDAGSRETWARAVIEKLTQGEIEEVIAAIEALPPLAPEPGKSRSLLESEADYFRANRHCMRYPAFRAQGMHLGIGIAEAACKTVVSTRAKRAACAGLLMA